MDDCRIQVIIPNVRLDWILDEYRCANWISITSGNLQFLITGFNGPWGSETLTLWLWHRRFCIYGLKTWPAWLVLIMLTKIMFKVCSSPGQRFCPGPWCPVGSVCGHCEEKRVNWVKKLARASHSKGQVLTLQIKTYIQVYSPVGVLLNHLKSLQGLKHFASHILGAHTEVRGAHAVPLTTSVDLDHGAYADTTTQVKVTYCGGWEEKWGKF